MHKLWPSVRLPKVPCIPMKPCCLILKLCSIRLAVRRASYRIATLQHKVFEDLKAGNLRWFEAVDLHGCTVEEARQAVLQIIQIAKDENQNVIKIVHGKEPEAILKTYVNGWLRQHRDVLAFVSAPEKQGGTGAVLVLLKRAEKIQSLNSKRIYPKTRHCKRFLLQCRPCSFSV